MKFLSRLPQNQNFQLYSNNCQFKQLIQYFSTSIWYTNPVPIINISCSINTEVQTKLTSVEGIALERPAGFSR